MKDEDVERVRYVASRLVLDILRILDSTRVKVGAISNAELIIALAVIAAEREGRPLTVNKLAYWIGMPRSTAGKHVANMVACGHITRDSKGQLKLAYSIDKTAVHNAYRFSMLIKRACADLSDLSVPRG